MPPEQRFHYDILYGTYTATPLGLTFIVYISKTLFYILTFFIQNSYTKT